MLFSSDQTGILRPSGLPARAAGPEQDTVWVSFPGHDIRLVAELVDTRAERYRGLAD